MKKTRGRPPGRTEQGDRTKELLYATAIRLFTEDGYDATTLREIAREAKLSPGLVYRYFPGKAAVVTELYDRLSAAMERRASAVNGGTWVDRFNTTVGISLSSLADHRELLRAVTPLMLIDPQVGLFSPLGAPGRHRVQRCFVRAVSEADDPPAEPVASALGRVLDAVQLGLILFWLLERSPQQRATGGLVQLVGRLAKALPTLLWLPGSSSTLLAVDAIITDGIYAPAQHGSDDATTVKPPNRTRYADNPTGPLTPD